jgi:GT2 family glycosyltransferase
MTIQVGILVLNYRQPTVTLACVRRLLEREGPGTRILWLENGARETLREVREVLATSGLTWEELDPEGVRLPDPGTIGLVPIPENLGYAGGNNVGARLCQRLGVPYLWVLNNDTLLERGSSADLVALAERRPEVGAWGTWIRSREGKLYSGGRIRFRDFSIGFVHEPEVMEADPLAFVSGCSLFFATEVGASVGFLPEHYFLYYEDPAFTLELRKKGLTASIQPEVEIFHEESLTTGRRSPLMEYYNRRNRWHFIARYFPEHLVRQKWHALYRFQSLLFRGAFGRIRLEWLAYVDYQAGRLGPTQRTWTRVSPSASRRTSPR